MGPASTSTPPIRPRSKPPAPRVPPSPKPTSRSLVPRAVPAPPATISASAPTPSSPSPAAPAAPPAALRPAVAPVPAPVSQHRWLSAPAAMCCPPAPAIRWSPAWPMAPRRPALIWLCRPRAPRPSTPMPARCQVPRRWVRSGLRRRATSSPPSTSISTRPSTHRVLLVPSTWPPASWCSSRPLPQVCWPRPITR